MEKSSGVPASESKCAGIYIHIPYCRSKCAYCSFVSDDRFGDIDAYVGALVSEIAERGKGISADTVYFGGGTPSVLPQGYITRILAAVRKNFSLKDPTEITVECNPDSATSGFFSECRAAGVNRISIGLQSASDRLMQKVGRPHTFAQFKEAVRSAREYGINNLSADIMLGLPGQSLNDAEQTIRLLLELEIRHISMYGLSVEEGTPLYKDGYSPDEDLCVDMYESCADMLIKNGFRRYEVSNFAKNGNICRHNMKYWTSAPYFGFGVAAHSFDGNTRYANTSDRNKYINGERISESVTLTERDKIEEYIMLSLRTDLGLDLKYFSEHFGSDLLETKREKIERLSAAGLIFVSENRLKLCDDAYYKMNSVIVSLI